MTVTRHGESMKYPSLQIDRKKLMHNAACVLDLCRRHGVDPHIVTKAFCAYEPMVAALAEAGVTRFADSRIQNLKKLQRYGTSHMMLRLPMISEADEVVALSDISLNSEYSTVCALSQAAQRQNKKHQILLMAELGDLREGVMLSDLPELARRVMKLPGLQLAGLGVNFNCYGGIIPDEDNLGKLTKIAHQIERTFDIKLSILSGGNSGSIYLMSESRLPPEINHLRIGEALLLGRETSFGQRLPGMYQDVIILKTQVVECLHKPSVPTGRIGQNAFGEKLAFTDLGVVQRAIVACGRQDTVCDALIPRASGIRYIGASSDHMILDVTDSEQPVEAGGILSFSLSYGALLSAFTSEYVHKYMIEESSHLTIGS
jgi:predicted amino acid racemase